MWHHSILKSYQHAQQWHIDIHEYYQEELYQLNQRIQKIRRLAKPEIHNDQLGNHIRSICYLLNQLFSLPLPPCKVLDEAERLHSLDKATKELAHHLPRLASELISIQEMFESITRADSALALKLMDLSDHLNKENSVFCVEKGSLVEPVSYTHL
nr:hypothetical protein [Endozoicomonas sp.]